MLYLFHQLLFLAPYTTLCVYVSGRYEMFLFVDVFMCARVHPHACARFVLIEMRGAGSEHGHA